MNAKHKAFLESKYIKQYIVTYGKSNWKDIYQDIFLIVDAMDDALFNDLMARNKFEFYVARIVFAQCVSNAKCSLKSKYEYSKEIPIEIKEINEEYDLDKDSKTQSKIDAINDFQTNIENLTQWYDSKILDHYINEGSLRKVEEKVGIGYNVVRYSLERSKETIKQKLKI